MTVDGSVPGPLLRFREGEAVTLRVRNELDEPTSIHWHGILLPFEMDGVPGVTFPGIPPGETFTYRYPVVQSGTYWYHSHTGLQEQLGHYGPLVIDPAGSDPVTYDREHVVVLGDWMFENPYSVLAKLKKVEHYSNYRRRTVGDFFRAISRNGLGTTLDDRLMWGRMRMAPTDIADVTGHHYTYLMNGQGPETGWYGLFTPGERVRLRVINAAAMSYFNLRIPGLPMTVVQTDGQNVEPVTVDELQIATAETFDVVVEPDAGRTYTVFAEAMDRSGYARGTLAPHEGMEAAVLELREPPLRTMVDMGTYVDQRSFATYRDPHSVGRAALRRNRRRQKERRGCHPSTERAGVRHVHVESSRGAGGISQRGHGWYARSTLRRAASSSAQAVWIVRSADSAVGACRASTRFCCFSSPRSAAWSRNLNR